LFFASFCVMSIAWLRPVVPLGLAVSSAAAYVGLWLIHLPPHAWASLQPRSPVSPAVTAYRVVLLLGLGALCAFAARGVRRALVSGVQTLRSRDLFGKYRLEEPLGEGGMGTVVKATYCPEGGFERPVAIKRILP